MKKRNAIAICVSLVYVAVMTIIWLNVMGEIINDSLNYLSQNIGIIISQAIVIGGAYLIYAFIKERETETVVDNKKKIDLRLYIICIISSAILIIIMLAFRELVGNIWYLTKKEVLFEFTLEESTTTLDITQILISIISVGIVTPVFEEMYFRKAIMGETSNVHPICLAIISVLTFLLMHNKLEQIVYIMPMAIYIVVIYMRTKNLRYCIFIHMIINCVGIFIKSKKIPVFSWQEAVLKDDKAFSLICIAGLILCIAVLIICLIYVNSYLKIEKKEKLEINIKESIVYVIVCVLFCTIMLTRLYSGHTEGDNIVYEDIDM